MPENYTQYSLTVLSHISPLPTDISLLAQKMNAKLVYDADAASGAEMLLRVTDDGLTLESDGKCMRCDLLDMARRISRGNLSGELLVKATRIKGCSRPLNIIDATAGLGYDALLLAACGHNVRLYERNPLIAALLRDALGRAANAPELADPLSRMSLLEDDSISALRGLPEPPDVIYLDPMFPEKEKSSLSKKKFQLLHHVELPCSDGEELLSAAIDAHPRRIVIKRPLKGEYLCGKKPSFSLSGKAVRYDCILLG